MVRIWVRSTKKWPTCGHFVFLPFTCVECSMVFTRAGNLNQHMVTHSGKKPFACSQCSASFHNHPASNIRWEHTAMINILSVVNVGKILPAAQTLKDICKLTVEKNIPVLIVEKRVHIHPASRHTWQHTQGRSHSLALSVAMHLLNPVN